ncbi:MAG: Na(+)-translocating NADH-quinone reductase subunit A, partial [Acidobacteriota bacterium]|nr:Na(+)-translocating NADH-quinone reductase subunit A [Acidobacteriota bacterium]
APPQVVHRSSRGLRLPISGQPATTIDGTHAVSRVGILGDDYVGLRPTFKVAVGDAVSRGQLLFEDKTMPGVRFTAPAEGRVDAINRGEKRAFQSLVIELSSAERSGQGAQVAFASFSGRHPSALSGDAIRELLLESGLWTALRARPFSRVANPADIPRSIFVTAIDSDPLAPDPEPIVGARQKDFDRGLAALAGLTEGPLFLCTSDRWSRPLPAIERLRHESFAGPHPAGTAGFHIHTLDPAGRGRIVWHIGYLDVVAIGRLFGEGILGDERIIALAGPSVRSPRLLRTRIGAAIDELTTGELEDDGARTVSGSVLSGRTAGGPALGYLGRYHRQICALPEGRQRDLLGWATPGLGKFSATRLFLSNWRPGRPLAMTTSTNGSPRAIVPIGLYEKVMPFDFEPTYLLKALVTHDVERAEQLGCLELDEEDVALCTFVCPGKHDYGRHLREVLELLEEEG